MSRSGSTSTDIYYPPSQEKSKWSALRNTMHFIRWEIILKYN